VTPALVRGQETGTHSTVYNHPASFQVGDRIISFVHFVSGGLAFDTQNLSLSSTGSSAYAVVDGAVKVATVSSAQEPETIIVTVAERVPDPVSLAGTFTIDRYLVNGLAGLPNYTSGETIGPIGLLPQAATSDNARKLVAVETEDGIKWTVSNVVVSSGTLAQAVVVYGDDDGGQVGYMSTEIHSSGGTADVDILIATAALQASLATETRPLALRLGVTTEEQGVEGEWVLTAPGVSRIGATGETASTGDEAALLVTLFNGTAFVTLYNDDGEGGAQVQDVSSPLTLVNYSTTTTLPDGTLDLYTSSSSLFSTDPTARVLAYNSGSVGILGFTGAAKGQYFVGVVTAADLSGLAVDNLRTRAANATAVTFVGSSGGTRFTFRSFVAERSTVGGEVVLRFFDGTTVQTIDKVEALVAPEAVETAATYRLVVLHVNGTLSLDDLSVTSVDVATSYLTQTGAMTEGGDASAIIATVPKQASLLPLQRFVVTVQANPTAEVFAADLLRRYTADDLTTQWPDAFRLDLDLEGSGGSIQDDAGGETLVYVLLARPTRNGSSGGWFIVRQSVEDAVSTDDIVEMLQGVWPERDVALAENSMILPWDSTKALEYRLLCQNHAAFRTNNRPLVSLGTYAVGSHRTNLCNAQFYDYQVPGSTDVTRSTLPDSGGAPVIVNSQYRLWNSVVPDGSLQLGFTPLTGVSASPIYFVD
jgi:hypothetical protein